MIGANTRAKFVSVLSVMEARKQKKESKKLRRKKVMCKSHATSEPINQTKNRNKASEWARKASKQIARMLASKHERKQADQNEPSKQARNQEAT